MPARLLAFDPERERHPRDYIIPDQPRVVYMAHKTKRRRADDTARVRDQRIMRGMALLIIVLALMLTAVLYRAAQPSRFHRYRPTPVLKALPAHAERAVFLTKRQKLNKVFSKFEPWEEP